MQLVGGGEAFDGLDILALRIDRQNGATVYGFAVHDDSAGATGSAVADALGTGDIEMVAQCVDRVTRGSTATLTGLPFKFSVMGTAAGPTTLAAAGAASASFSSNAVPSAPEPSPTPRMKPRRENPDLGWAGSSGSFRELTRHLPFVPLTLK